MNRQQAKEILPLVQALAEGKIIEVKSKLSTEWIETSNPILDKYHDYRIKPEPKYRPFANKYECWQEMLKHQPFGWVKSSENNYFVISAIRNEDICINGGQYWAYYNSVLNKYTFADGTPFGIKE